ncbi:MAG: hypothetical protein D6714_14960 [Bacteroidetes bacterium]|nr:MAG: hypothetical protein D6714_14960 [Bacteroidota bacterium]
MLFWGKMNDSIGFGHLPQVFPRLAFACAGLAQIKAPERRHLCGKTIHTHFQAPSGATPFFSETNARKSENRTPAKRPPGKRHRSFTFLNKL